MIDLRQYNEKKKSNRGFLLRSEPQLLKITQERDEELLTPSTLDRSNNNSWQILAFLFDATEKQKKAASCNSLDRKKKLLKLAKNKLTNQA